MKAKDFKNTYHFDDGNYRDAVWFNVKDFPITLYGLYNPKVEKHFMRMPSEIAEKVSDGVKSMNLYPSGGRCSFATDSPYIAIHAVQPTFYVMPHMPRSGNAGFDVYVCGDDNNQTYAGTLFAPNRKDMTYFSDVNSMTTLGSVFNYMLYFPLYENCDNAYIGVDPEAEFSEYVYPYADFDPVIFYGSSITQGGCVCRPGNAYPALISRKYHVDFRNLGFSGAGKAEDIMVDYLSKQKMSIFVCDYDHNAPSAQYLKETHFKMYQKIRASQPNLPYIMISKPDTLWKKDNEERRDIIFESYQKAKELGDENVYFLDGGKFFESEYFDACTVDLCHPNDYGHLLMAMKIGDVVGKILNKT